MAENWNFFFFDQRRKLDLTSLFYCTVISRNFPLGYCVTSISCNSKDHNLASSDLKDYYIMHNIRQNNCNCNSIIAGGKYPQFVMAYSAGRHLGCSSLVAHLLLSHKK